MATKKVRVSGYDDGKISVQAAGEAEPREFNVTDGLISPRSNEERDWLVQNLGATVVGQQADEG